MEKETNPGIVLPIVRCTTLSARAANVKMVI